MKKIVYLNFFLLFASGTLNTQNALNKPNSLLAGHSSSNTVTIICPASSPANIKLAAREVRRYLYLRTATLLPIAEDAAGDVISFRIDNTLEEQQFRLKSDGKSMVIAGGSDVAVLYGAYAFAEKLGVRFQLDGDVIPDAQIPFSLPGLDETHKPVFRLRGIQPFHDFPEGPDWWTTDDWKVISGQVAKMRMNFIGLHTYPFKNKDLGPEPTVWIGLPEDVNADGTVKVADKSSWYTTAKFIPYGCYAPGETGTFSFGADQLFPADDYGPEINGPDDFPFPPTPEACVDMANRSGKMLNEVFTDARELGIKTAVGTESPLDIPDAIAEQLKSRGLNPDDPATLEKLYEGMFLRIKRTYPVDYYWIWGHEGEIDENRFITNINSARSALRSVEAPFSLGLCGWGWTAGHFPQFDKTLPKDVFFSSISHNVGNTPVSPNFAGLEGRVKFAIPWAEDDGNLTAFQLLVGRMRRDAVDAQTYGCDGLFCLHWRTRVINPNISALAQAGWELGDWGRSSDAVNKDSLPRNLASDDFYLDWTAAQFGPAVAKEIAAIFTKLDGNYPRTSTWNRGPGVININKQSWQEVKNQYAFAEEMESLRPRVRGSGNLARFDWWNHEFQFMKSMAMFACARGELDAALAGIEQIKDPAAQRKSAISEVLPIRLKMTNLLGTMYEHMIATLNNSSELGTIANIELQSLLRCKLLTAQDETLEKLAGAPLPAEARPRKEYSGTPLLVNLVVRTTQKRGEALLLRIIALDKQPVKSVLVKFRTLGGGKWETIEAKHIARAVWNATLPAPDDDFEYQIVSETSGGTKMKWPATAPEINQTVVIRE
ncbi:MAG: hypothetical protein WC865_01505 [Bacteroidales bacterium]